ncbi:Glycosyltransferase AglJ [Gracilariopsis chorda]|uniref:Glycosyltransferase AglJ n=1 Tax=Gracilariopsis chorda TaxID=448386 RepID=A0A2V3J3S7_9FLOR|nr:Glycosyltransferase AglJ [Gracilariopsis chorda]|eukprot:PXF49034.1 Glycosyltransferase AglJ [Gracilariopsis chorda]
MLHLLRTVFPPPPQTAVIIPTYNESSTISETVRAVLQRSTERLQVIVADGFSTDDTAQKARRAGARVLRVRGGRGQQLNKGAELAKAPNLLFLHADTKVPPAFDVHIKQLLQRPDVVAGAFRLHIDSNMLGIKLVQQVANWRSIFFQRPYGDQGLFITKRQFDRIGGYEPMPFLEDYQIVRTLSRHGRIAIANSSVVTNARRWETLGVARTTFFNQVILLAYHVGIQPSILRSWYRGMANKAITNSPNNKPAFIRNIKQR